MIIYGVHIFLFDVELPAPDTPHSLFAASITTTMVLLEWQPPADLTVPVHFG